jgi:retron-type reverse transcriptase
MKRLGNLWETLVATDNLYSAFYKARKGKRARPEVAAFSLNLEGEILELQRQLKTGSYQPGPYRQFTVYERKPRQICAAPFRDRVVHHAIMNIIEPTLDRRFISDSYACRPDKGVHRAVDRYQEFAQDYVYVLKLDIRRYFPSIDHIILKAQLARRIKDRKVLSLLHLIVDSSPDAEEPLRLFPGDDLVSAAERRSGIPIGNLTSQFFANLYLDDFDHHLKQAEKLRAYIRYVDDLYLFGNDKHQLWELQSIVAEKLADLRLILQPDKTQIYRTSTAVDVLGYRISRDRRWLRNDNGYRFQRRLRKFSRLFSQGKVVWKDINASIQSWIGHARHGETHGLRRAIFSEVLFTRGTGRDAASA